MNSIAPNAGKPSPEALVPDDISALKTIFSCIDNTSLNGDDTHAGIRRFCDDTLRMADAAKGIEPVAAVCVYPVFVKTARQVLLGSNIKVASVAGAFPSGQSPVAVKVMEVRYAVDEGADEIDMVLNRGALLEGSRQQVFDEVAAIREACRQCTLKVILETGELKDAAVISDACKIAIDAGADFIKTSTGKIPAGATLEAAEVMLKAVAENAKISKRTIGIKVSGGVSQPLEALKYYRQAQNILRNNNITNQIFRIGTSRLTALMYRLLTLQTTGI